MATKSVILAALAGAVALFLFDGALQVIPEFGVRAVQRLETNEFTTAKFSELTHAMAYIVTDKTVSFVATKPADYYSLPRFFAFEFLSALAIAGLWAVLFARIRQVTLKERLLLTLVVAIIASFAIHLPYYNWWGFSFLYTAGVCAKTILGWILIAIVQNRFIYKIK